IRFSTAANRSCLWTSVDKTERWQFSSKLVDFPQVFHIDLWTEKASSYGQFSGFYTYPQALLLLLDINELLKSIRFSKGSNLFLDAGNFLPVQKRRKDITLDIIL